MEALGGPQATQDSFLSITSSKKSKAAGGWGRSGEGGGEPPGAPPPFLKAVLSFTVCPSKHPDLPVPSRLEGGGGVTPRGLERSQRLLMGNANIDAGTPVPSSEMEPGTALSRQPSAHAAAPGSSPGLRRRPAQFIEGTVILDAPTHCRPSRASPMTICYCYTLLLSVIAYDYFDYFNLTSGRETQLPVPLRLPVLSVPGDVIYGALSSVW